VLRGIILVCVRGVTSIFIEALFLYIISILKLQRNKTKTFAPGLLISVKGWKPDIGGPEQKAFASSDKKLDYSYTDHAPTTRQNSALLQLHATQL
jgi:hypothetical protein